jgi:hypothetical protein
MEKRIAKGPNKKEETIVRGTFAKHILADSVIPCVYAK